MDAENDVRSSEKLYLKLVFTLKPYSDSTLFTTEAIKASPSSTYAEATDAPNRGRSEDTKCTLRERQPFRIKPVKGCLKHVARKNETEKRRKSTVVTGNRTQFGIKIVNGDIRLRWQLVESTNREENFKQMLKRYA